jgi:hypothetical protein
VTNQVNSKCSIGQKSDSGAPSAAKVATTNQVPPGAECINDIGTNVDVIKRRSIHRSIVAETVTSAGRKADKKRKEDANNSTNTCDQGSRCLLRNIS